MHKYFPAYCIYLEDDDQQRHSDGHNNKRGDEPGDPVYGIRQTHHFHDFL